MPEDKTTENRLFIIDTNVLMHDPMALYRFKRHDIYVPMVVLEELDKAKKGVSEVARNVRQASRIIDQLITGRNREEIMQGLPLSEMGEISSVTSGRLFLQTLEQPAVLPDSLPGTTPDNAILGIALALSGNSRNTGVTLVSKDINLRIKAAALGIHAEDYYNDQVLEDVDLLYSGTAELPGDFWETHGKELDSWKEKGQTYYRIKGPLTSSWTPNL